ncbi:MAG: DNA primase [Candidatus Tagabacteria bacterium CG_4_9_14_0_2_um_filter_41_11]|nr:MAG: DNA primase [Candidatus Tagabacteria bacterium CG11_big_fil_rev_8_21_14_0_20_41_11]PJC25067.1 MAG: DNA primase [Candidatus Tagabacteria bacterium CG_4_9_14_0_2_um_filter_41_11]
MRCGVLIFGDFWRKINIMSSPVEQIKQRISVVDLIQSYIKLDKAGVNFKARCPFHSEKTPSFVVSPSRDIWHCFGCNRGGDIFAFVMEIEGVEFIEALRILAERAGIKLKMEDPRLRNERTRLLELMKDATDFYRNELISREEVLEYLRKRGLKDSTIQSYLLGYAPPENSGWRKLYEFLLGKGYSDEEIEKSGMAIKAEDTRKRYYDRFRGRIMFPIFDFSGRTVAFSGRIFPEEGREGVGKYINSPQTVLYDKSRILYGFDRAKTEIRKKDACVIVEGQMDVIMSHQADVLNAVAISGTGLTPYHLESIGRLTNNLIVSFDSDEAGLIAAGRGIDLALERGFEVKVVSLPFGKDPADVVHKDPVAWQKAVEESHHIIDFYLKTLAEKISDSRELKRKAEQIVLPYLFYIESEIDKSHWVGEIAKCLKMNEEPIWEQLKKMKLKKIKTEENGGEENFPADVKTRRLLLEERLLGIVFWKNDAKIIPDDKYSLFSDKHQFLLKNSKGRSKLQDESKHYWERLALEGELSYDGIEDAKLKDEVKILLNGLEREILQGESEAIAASIKKFEAEGNEEALAEQLNKFNDLNKQISQISKNQR